MSVHVATKTLAAIDAAIEKDGGALFREYSGKVLPHIGDAYRGDAFPFRNHMGASGIGDQCLRKVWYGFRWVTKPTFPARVLRLFNRGHLEEGRFIALLLAIGCKVVQQDSQGRQFTISESGGHFGGSGDGVVFDLPDLDPNTPALSEFKTASDKKFKVFKKEGVKKANWVYYIQMQVYMRKMGLAVAFFMVVNKNDDDLYAELVFLDDKIADEYLARGRDAVFYKTAPIKINEQVGWWECRFCDHKPVCKLGDAPERNCRTCEHANIVPDGTWRCDLDINNKPRDKHEQLAGCSDYTMASLFDGVAK